MNDLDNIKKLLVQGDKEAAINRLVSSLQLNSNNVEAWLLLSEIIDDPMKKRDCYNQVLQLSPNNPLALKGLRDWASSNSVYVNKPIIDDQDLQHRTINSKETVQNLLQNKQVQQSPKRTKLFNRLKDEWLYPVIAILCIGGFFGLSYILGLILTIGDPSSDSDPLCIGMLCLSLIAGGYIWYTSSKSRSRVANTAIQDQIHIQYSNSTTYSSSEDNTISCRVCNHRVSRTAPSCPNCGELYPGLISKCPYCGSKNIRITQKGFSVGKATAGAVIVGPVGLAGGLLGRKDLEVKCENCQQTLKIKNEEIG